MTESFTLTFTRRHPEIRTERVKEMNEWMPCWSWWWGQGWSLPCVTSHGTTLYSSLLLIIASKVFLHCGLVWHFRLYSSILITIFHNHKMWGMITNVTYRIPQYPRSQAERELWVKAACQGCHPWPEEKCGALRWFNHLMFGLKQ